MILAPVGHADAPALAKLHARAFESGWSAADIEALLAAPGGFGLAARAAQDPVRLHGFLLARVVAGEAEILTLAVDPAHRRQGLARALLTASLAAAQAAGAEAVFLEVAADNIAALGLYQSEGFERVGRRPGYYARSGGAAADALVLRFNTAPCA
jgi:ribosomal-protein-alanine N-acetyltransferase